MLGMALKVLELGLVLVGLVTRERGPLLQLKNKVGTWRGEWCRVGPHSVFAGEMGDFFDFFGGFRLLQFDGSSDLGSPSSLSDDTFRALCDTISVPFSSATGLPPMPRHDMTQARRGPARNWGVAWRHGEW